MVFFTCNKCGESLKKKDVEKHCSFRCKGSPFLTCVDCLKDFREDFVKHTACVSEKDRYSSQGLKGIQKSKQQIWVETVHDSCSRAIDDGILGITPSIRQLLIWLQEQNSIPDKVKTFSNFILNARRTEPKANVDFVWNILDKARNELQAKLKAEREAAEAEKRKAKQEKMMNRKDSSDSDDADSSNDEDESKEKSNGSVKNGDESPPKQEEVDAKNGKKDKKKKRMVSESDSVVNGTSELKKTKKSKKNPQSDESEESSNLNNAMHDCHLNVAITEEGPMLSKKERKEKKKREKYEAELKRMESVETADQAEGEEETEVENVVENEGKKGKKKKNKKNLEESTPADEEPAEPKERKKKEKKNKRQLQEEADQANAEVSEKKKKNGKFNSSGVLNEDLDTEQTVEFSWDTTILQVLESEEEISLKKLSKKVLNEYLVSVGEDAHVDEVKIMNKFHKKLHKMHNVLVHKDKVRLKTSRD